MRRERLPGIGLLGILVSLALRDEGRVSPTVRVTIIKKDLWSFCCISGDLDDVAVSSARAAALEGAFETHGETRRTGRV
jgi:hypothetical protein